MFKQNDKLEMKICFNVFPLYFWEIMGQIKGHHGQVLETLLCLTQSSTTFSFVSHYDSKRVANAT